MSREGLGDGVEQCLNAPGLCRRAAEHRNDAAVYDTLMYRLDSLVVADLYARKIFLHQLVGNARNRLKQHIAVAVDDLLIARRYLRLGVRALLVVNVGLFVDELYKALDLVALDHRYHQRTDRNTESVVQLGEHAVEAAFGVVEFVYEKRLRYPRVGSGIPCELRSDLNPRLTVDDDYRAVRDTYSLLYLSRKAEITGRVDNVYLCILPHDRRNSRLYRVAAARLLGIIVKYGISFSDGTETVGPSGDIQHRLGNGGLSRAAVSEKADITDLFCANHVHCDYAPFNRLLIIIGAG